VLFGVRLYGRCIHSKQQYQQIAQQSSQRAPLAAGDVQGVMERIQQDYQQAYFVTGGRVQLQDAAAVACPCAVMCLL
jgi:hypothetical protein